jgi:protocatechuate 3,4-dioxygenase, alpha subunit
MSLWASTSQTIGPFFSIGLNRLKQDNLVGEGVSGERVTIAGRMLDGDGKPVPDGLVETWQANAHGKYAHPEDDQDKSLEAGFKGYGRVMTDDQGKFQFTTIKPGQAPAPDGKTQAPHIAVSVFARGLEKRLVTRIYFPDEPSNSSDFALNLVESGRRETLIAKKIADKSGALEWNIILQGPCETVFFDCGL